MLRMLSLAAALAALAAGSLHAQRLLRFGPSVATLSLEDLAGTSHRFTGVGAQAALVTGDEGELGLAVARYPTLSTDGRVRRLTLFALDSYYYPVGVRGVAPFAATTLGLARVTESSTSCLLLCSDTVATASEFALAFGLGVRANLGSRAVASVEGRFVEIPGSQIQGLEAQAGAAVALGPRRPGELAAGTLGPQASFFIPISGALRGRAPFLGVRFRRDTKRSGAVGLEIDFAELRLTQSCTPNGCNQPNAVLFAPAYEASVWPQWGRLYAGAGLLLAGIYTQGPDRGMAQGAHGGVGADFVSGSVMWNLNARLLWLTRSSGDNVFGLEVGVGVAPPLAAPRRPPAPAVR